MPQLVDILKSIHLMDIVLVVIIAGFALLGYAQGAVKLFIILASIFVGFVTGAIYYLPVADLIESGLHIGLINVAQVIAFLIINAVVAVLLIILMFQFFGHLDVQGRLGACIGRPVGMLLGFLTGVLLTAIFVILLEVPYEFYNEVQLAGNQAPYLAFFHDWYGTSTLAQALRQGLPILLGVVTPILGGHAPPILLKPAGVSMLPLGLALIRRES